MTCDVTPATSSPTRAWAPSRRWLSWRDLIAAGADPPAITDNMNFGNPERPEVMGQFVSAIKGMKEACEVLKYPVVVGQRLALQRDQTVSPFRRPRNRWGGVDPRHRQDGRHRHSRRPATC